ncbi:MAG TPA: pyridoxal phosphate-dependent aminotransferase, partial [Candidatus Acidoferrum sp.]|jgi:histidinol-phosphate aminotransferase|nr:pyridoxal phosphate-dependent aminotransferase [Candidatus Acidoferrum sp.]
MNLQLNEQMKRDLAQRGFSRRSLGRIAAMISAGAALPFYNEPAMAQLSAVRDMPADAVKINANENPLGPCPEALEAIHNIAAKGGRYLYEETFGFQEVLAEQEGVKANYVQPYAGSSAPLHQAVLAFTSPTRPFVTANPGYEAGERAAQFIGAPVLRVPLTSTYAHDVKKMAAASPDAGLIYVCNPNNPTGTLTPREDIEWLLANKPAGSILLLDEAYIHIAGAPMCSDLVAKDKDIVILRTFSKIYGMAGIRAGAAIGRPDLLKKLGNYSTGALPVTGMAAGTASLKSKTVIPQRRKIIGDVRTDVLSFLDKHNFKYVPSVSNKFMVDVKRPGGEIIAALQKEKVYIGRVWPSWPTYVRVSVGTQAEMDKFKTAFLKVMV